MIAASARLFQTPITCWILGIATVLLACAAVETAWAAWRWREERRDGEAFARWYWRQ